MTLRAHCRAFLSGGLDIMAMARAGELTPRKAWVAMKGAEKYVRAVASGDVADSETITLRLAQCRVCPAASVPGRVYLSYCGTPLDEKLDGPVQERTCGCVCAGKASVQSEKCPRGRW